MDSLSPFIYWAQSAKNVFLKVDVQNVEKMKLTVNGRKINFLGEGVGAGGLNKYEFNLDFYGDVLKEPSVNVNSKVDINFVKSEEGWWPRLTAQPQKPAWLKIDFDKWQSEEDLNDDVRDVRDDYPDIYEQLQKEERGYKKEDFKKVFMICHNFIMYLGFFYVVCVLGIRFLKDGPDSYFETYKAVGHIMKLLHIIMCLEVIYPMLGYSKGSPLVAFMQIFGRCFVLFGMIDMEPRMQIKPVVFYLFLVWSTVELVRYPYYITQLYKKENAWLTWLRYTIWIPLYPLGFLCEGIIVLRSIPYAEETKLFSMTLPNDYNFVFDYPTVLRIYLLIILSSMYTMMSYMYKGRKAKLGSGKKKGLKVE